MTIWNFEFVGFWRSRDVWTINRNVFLFNQCARLLVIHIANICSSQASIHSSRDQWEAGVENCPVSSLTIVFCFCTLNFIPCASLLSVLSYSISKGTCIDLLHGSAELIMSTAIQSCTLGVINCNSVRGGYTLEHDVNLNYFLKFPVNGWVE